MVKFTASTPVRMPRQYKIAALHARRRISIVSSPPKRVDHVEYSRSFATLGAALHSVRGARAAKGRGARLIWLCTLRCSCCLLPSEGGLARFPRTTERRPTLGISEGYASQPGALEWKSQKPWAFGSWLLALETYSIYVVEERIRVQHMQAKAYLPAGGASALNLVGRDGRMRENARGAIADQLQSYSCTKYLITLSVRKYSRRYSWYSLTCLL